MILRFESFNLLYIIYNFSITLILCRRGIFNIEDDSYEVQIAKTYRADVYRYTNNILQHFGLVIHYKDVDEDEGLPGKYLYKVIDGGEIWARCTRFTQNLELAVGAELELVVEDAQISKEQAEEICHVFNQGHSHHGNNNGQEFVNDMLYQLRLAPAYTFRQRPTPVPSFSSFSSSSSYLSSVNLAFECCKLMSKDLERCEEHITRILNSLEIEDVASIVRKMMRQISSLSREERTDWWAWIRIFGEVLLEKLGPQFFENLDRETIRRMGDKYKSLRNFVDHLQPSIGFQAAVLLWFAIQITIYLIQKVSILIIMVIILLSFFY